MGHALVSTAVPCLLPKLRLPAQVLRAVPPASRAEGAGELAMRRRDRIEQRIAAIRSAMPLTEDAGVVDPAKLLQLRPLLVSIVSFDDEIQRLCARIAEVPMLAGAAAGRKQALVLCR